MNSWLDSASGDLDEWARQHAPLEPDFCAYVPVGVWEAELAGRFCFNAIQQYFPCSSNWIFFSCRSDEPFIGSSNTFIRVRDMLGFLRPSLRRSVMRTKNRCDRR
jgi:hypothetical protein